MRNERRRKEGETRRHGKAGKGKARDSVSPSVIVETAKQMKVFALSKQGRVWYNPVAIFKGDCPHTNHLRRKFVPVEALRDKAPASISATSS